MNERKNESKRSKKYPFQISIRKNLLTEILQSKVERVQSLHKLYRVRLPFCNLVELKSNQTNKPTHLVWSYPFSIQNLYTCWKFKSTGFRKEKPISFPYLQKCKQWGCNSTTSYKKTMTGVTNKKCIKGRWQEEHRKNVSYAACLQFWVFTKISEWCCVRVLL